MDFIRALQISSSGMNAQRRRMEIIAGNLANLETTRTPEGGPYRRKLVVMAPKEEAESFDSVMDEHAAGVKVTDIIEDNSPYKKEYNPHHPDADEKGYLLKPNVDLIVESTNMLMARRSFEANLAALKMTRQMILKALEIGR